MHIIIALIASLALLLPGSGLLAQSVIEGDHGPATDLSQERPDFDDRFDDDFDADLDNRGPSRRQGHDLGNVPQAPSQSQSQSQSQDKSQSQDENQSSNEGQSQNQGDAGAQDRGTGNANSSKNRSQQDGTNAQGTSLDALFSMTSVSA